MNKAQVAFAWLTAVMTVVGATAVVVLSCRNESIWAGVVLTGVAILGYLSILSMILADRGNTSAPG